MCSVWAKLTIAEWSGTCAQGLIPLNRRNTFWLVFGRYLKPMDRDINTIAVGGAFITLVSLVLTLKHLFFYVGQLYFYFVHWRNKMNKYITSYGTV